MLPGFAGRVLTLPHEAPPLRPRWLWVAFAILAILIPLIGFWLERRR